MGIIAWLVVGAFAGYLASFLVNDDQSLDIVGYILLGIAGAVICGFMAVGLIGSRDYTIGINIPTIVEAVVGAVIAVVGYNVICGRSGTGRGVVQRSERSSETTVSSPIASDANERSDLQRPGVRWSPSARP